jgi:hypothetical protein
MKSNGMDTCFKAKQSVDIVIPPESLPIEQYLRQSERIVNALASLDGSRSGNVTALGGELFRLALRPFGFLTLNLQPIVDLRVWMTADQVNVSSVGCEILGLEQFSEQQFELKLLGEMYPVVARGVTRLQGQVSLQVLVDMPMPIKLTPKPVLEGTGNTIMSGVLTTMKQRLQKNLVVDYRDWVREEARSVLATH